MQYDAFHPGKIWGDNNGVHINAHGGGFLRYENWWYWYGEHKIGGEAGNKAYVGVHLYKSNDLYNWTDCGIALDLRDNKIPMLPLGCVLERPKVIYCKSTDEFVMWFHFEGGKKGLYRDAKCGIATAKKVDGPFMLEKIIRPDQGHWPINCDHVFYDTDSLEAAKEKTLTLPGDEREDAKGWNFVGLGFREGQESRDFTLFVDDDKKAYLIYSSEVNSTLHISELTDDYKSCSGKWVRVFPERWMEAPTIFKHQKRYYMVMSGCSGWAPNAARGAWSDTIWGPWREIENPAQGEGSDTTFDSQGSFVLPLGKGRFIFAADRWNSDNAIDGRYVWLPLEIDRESIAIRFRESWKLTLFK